MKQEQVIQEEYMDTVRAFRDGTKKAKPHLEFNLVRGIKGNRFLHWHNLM